MSSRKPHWRPRGGGRGSNSKKTAFNLETGSGPGSTTPVPDASALHTADSPQHSEGDITNPPIAPTLEAIGEQETVQRLVSVLTTPSTVPFKPVVGFAPTNENEYVDTLMNDPDSDDEGANDAPGVKLAKTKPSDTHSDKVPPSTDPREHPRPKAKSRQNNRRVSEEQSQVDSAELLWFNAIYDSTFNTSESGVIFAIIPITLSSGLSLRAGDAIPADVAELYVQHIQDTTQHARRQEMLSSFIAPVAKVQKLGEDVSRTTTSRRRRTTDEDDKSISSFGDERSIVSAASDSANRRGLGPAFNTADPLDKSQPMPSPISNHQGQFPFRREHVSRDIIYQAII